MATVLTNPSHVGPRPALAIQDELQRLFRHITTTGLYIEYL
jgi:hypothetical protein